MRELERYPSRKQIIEWIELFPLGPDFRDSQMSAGAALLKAKMVLALR